LHGHQVETDTLTFMQRLVLRINQSVVARTLWCNQRPGCTEVNVGLRDKNIICVEAPERLFSGMDYVYKLILKSQNKI
jgi:hypothetical protein